MKIISLFVILFALGTWADQNVIWSYPSVSVNDSVLAVLYNIYDFPYNGTILEDGVEVDDIVTNFTHLTYAAFDPYEFSVANGSCFAPTDMFSFRVRVLYNLSTTEFILPVNVCVVDAQDLPVTSPLRYIVTNQTNEPLNITVVDHDDNEIGTQDGLSSYYSFLGGGGVIFDKVSTSIGYITDCAGTNLSVGVKHAPPYCFQSNTLVGFDNLTFYAVDKAGGTSNVTSLFVTTNEYIVCNPYTCTPFDMDENTTTNFSIPVTAITLYPSTYRIRILSLPSNGLVYNMTGGLVHVGDTYAQYEVSNFTYAPPDLFFNRYYFPYGDDIFGYGTTLGGPIIDGCTDDAYGCPDIVTYEAYSGVFTSVTGSLQFYVDYEIIDDMQACVLYPASVFADACASYGDESTVVPVFLHGSDGRFLPDFKMKITALPLQGTLYEQIGNQTTWITGRAVQVNDMYEHNTLTLPNFLYVPVNGTFNRYKTGYGYYEYVDDRGNPIDNGCQVTLDDNCLHHIEYQVISAVNASDYAEGSYDIVISRPAPDFLSVCVSPNRLWNTTCMSFGYETNDYVGVDYIAIFLDANNTTPGTVFQLTRDAFNGNLFYNIGNETSYEVGEPVRVGDNVSISYVSPQWLYAGRSDYFNQKQTDDGRYTYLDMSGYPFDDSCPLARVIGCPDTFQFRAISDDGRISNVGRYEVYVTSQISNVSEIHGPQYIIYDRGIPYTFDTLEDSIIYTNPDNDAYYLSVRIASDDGVVGMTGNTDGLIFPVYTPYTCFNTTGCEGDFRFYALGSDISLVLSNLFFMNPRSATLYTPVYIYISIDNILPNGANISTYFTFDANNTLGVAWDIMTLSSDAGDIQDVQDAADDIAYTDSQTAPANADVAHTLNIVLGTGFGISLAFNLLQLYLRCRVKQAVVIEEKQE